MADTKVQIKFNLSELHLNLNLNFEDESRDRPPASECASIYELAPVNFDSAYPLDVYNFGKKYKPPTNSFYERLRDLRDANRVFVKPVTKPIIRYLDMKCQFEVLDAQGEPIYFVLDTTDAWASTIFEGQGTKPFNVMILDYDYTEVIKITGPGLNRLHGSAWVKHCGKEIGRIVQDDHLCTFSPTYSIKGVNEVIGLKVKGPANSYVTGLPDSPDFEIYLPDEICLMGLIKREWLNFGKASEGALPEDTYTVSFHQNMDLRTKCLILSLVFMLDYQFYHKTVKSGVSRKIWALFVIGFGLCVVLLYVFVNEIKIYKSSSVVIPTTHKIDDHEFNLTSPMTPSNSLMNLTLLDAENFDNS